MKKPPSLLRTSPKPHYLLIPEIVARRQEEATFLKPGTADRDYHWLRLRGVDMFRRSLMRAIQIIALLVTLTALFSYLNFKLIRLPTTIGVMLIALVVSLGLI